VLLYISVLGEIPPSEPPKDSASDVVPHPPKAYFAAFNVPVVAQNVPRIPVYLSVADCETELVVPPNDSASCAVPHPPKYALGLFNAARVDYALPF